MIVWRLATALTGILLFGLGLARAGGAIRFIPYPVIGGFLSATGWLMVSGAVHVITDQRLTRSTLASLLGATTLAQACRRHRRRHCALSRLATRRAAPLLLPAVLLAAIALRASRLRAVRA